MSIFLGSGSLSSVFTVGSVQNTLPVSNSVYTIASPNYNGTGSNWPSEYGGITIYNYTTSSATPSTLSKLDSNGFWQFNGSSSTLVFTEAVLQNHFKQTGSATQPYTMILRGTFGTLGASDTMGLMGNFNYVNDGAASGSDIIINAYDSATSKANLTMRGKTGDLYTFRINYVSGSVTTLSVLYNNYTASVWQDGVYVAESSSAASVPSLFVVNPGYSTIFGNNLLDGSKYFNGSLGNLYIYNKLFTSNEVIASYNFLASSSKAPIATEVGAVYNGSNLVYSKDIPTTTSTTTTTAAPSIPTNGLQLYLNPATGSSWPGSGSTLYDLSGNARNFTLQGSPSFTGSNSFGFNGSNYLNNSSAGLNILSATSSFSIYTFFKPSTTGTVSGVQQVMSKNQNSPNYMGWAVGYNGFTGGGEGRWGLDMLGTGGGGDRIAVDTTNAYTSSRFVGNCITYNGNANASGVKLYFNAVSGAVATTVRSNSWTTATNPQTTAPTNVAGRDNSTNFFSGRVGAVLIYNRELSSTEVTTIYNLLSASFTN